ncbi:MAG: type II secretion system F family protein [Patescibacteria group bacterium]|nr:type II secretion system F family protein [Patescibacteria group bacterium]MDE2144627.1 type II secretion system F family protein [Patescibacteria group bacterium]
MKFRYQARTQSGELQVGFVEAPNKKTAIGILTSHNLFILSITDTERKGLDNQLYLLVNHVKGKDLMVFTRQFATLLEAKVPLGDALRTLIRQTRNPVLQEAIINVGEDVSSGLSLSQAMGKQSAVFSEFYVNMLQSGEVTGRVEEVMGFLADYIERNVSLAGRVRNALIYPFIMVILFIVVGVIMGTIVLPQLGSAFEQVGAQLPFITQWLIVGGKFTANWWWIILMALSVFIISILDYLRTPEGRTVYDEFVLRIPVFNTLLKEMYVSRFAESLAVLIRGGVPIAQAMEVTSRTIGSRVYEEILRKAADSLRKGELLSQALFREYEYFPQLVGQMVAVGESTGKLEDMLLRVSSFYSREVDDAVDNLVEAIQPIMMIVIGGLVGLLFASILIPIYSLVSVIGQQ